MRPKEGKACPLATEPRESHLIPNRKMGVEPEVELSLLIL